MEIIITIWLILGLPFACFSGYIATQKNRSFLNWFLLSLVFGLLALIAIACVPKKEN